MTRNDLMGMMFGAALWIAGVVLVKLMGVAFGTTGGTALFFLAGIAIAAATVWGARLIFPRAPILRLIAVGCVTAMALDGVTVAFMPEIYLGEGPQMRRATGLLLWVFAMTLGAAVIADTAADRRR